MRITNIEKTNSGTYYTIEVVNKLIQADKILEIIENIEDYVDKNGNFDKNLIKEDILNPRTYVVKVSNNETTCTCKNSLFRKTPCRHIKWILEQNGKNQI